jgi:hypothetical protein
LNRASPWSAPAGQAQSRRDHKKHPAQAGFFISSNPKMLAPEELRGKKKVPPKADVFLSGSPALVRACWAGAIPPGSQKTSCASRIFYFE